MGTPGTQPNPFALTTALLGAPKPFPSVLISTLNQYRLGVPDQNFLGPFQLSGPLGAFLTGDLPFQFLNCDSHRCLLHYILQ